MTYHFKRWLIDGVIDSFDVFLNLRQSGIEISITNEEPQVLTHSGRAYQFAGKRLVEARTTTEEQETLLFLSCHNIRLIEEKTIW
jgi:hypothetical protein